MIKTLRNTKAAKDAAQVFLNVWKNAKGRAFFRMTLIFCEMLKLDIFYGDIDVNIL